MVQSGQFHVQMPPLSRAVRIIVIVCASMFLLQLIAQAVFHISLNEFLGLVPARVAQGWIWQPLTYAFLHAGIFHLLFNLLVVWSIGSELEYLWGTRFFVIFYFVCICGAAVTYGLFSILGIGSGPDIAVIGSSGAVYGLLMAYGILFGDRLLYFFMLFPMRARHFVMILGAVELVSSIFYSRHGIAHTAHLGGMFSGFGLLWLKAYTKRKKRVSGTTKRPTHLRLVKNEDEDDEPPPPIWH